MQRNTFLITAITAIGLLFLISRISDTAYLAWRRVLYESPGVMGSYQATLHCKGPKEDLTPGAYMVYLNHGCSLEEHKRAVGKGADLDSAIGLVFLEVGPYGFCYEAKLNENALAAVRSDLCVDMIECEYRARVTPLDVEEVL